MEDNKKTLYAKDAEKLQITHDEYVTLMEKVEEVKHLQQVKEAVVTDLQRFLDGGPAAQSEPSYDTVDEPEPSYEDNAAPESSYEDNAAPEPSPENNAAPESTLENEVEPEPSCEDKVEPDPEPAETESPEAEKASVEFSSEEPELPKQQPVSNVRTDTTEVPPIKNEITEHFNKFDESGRLFNVFKQYYTCLNEACGGTVRVTMKDGFCSLWNYDEWEEFAFVDIFEGLLRIAIDPRYTDALKSLSLCEAPRLISSRRNVICVQIDDLNNTVLEVLTRAFSEVGMQVG